MADIIPFKGTLYNPQNIKDLTRVVAPPYDVISPGEQERFYNVSPYNIIRILLAKEEPGDNEKKNRYIRAARSLRDWQRSGILKKDEEDSIYIYEQQFSVEGSRKKRLGFMALLKLEEFDTDSTSVYPHEYTLDVPKRDRIALLSSIEANLGPVFALFADKDRAIGSILAREIKSNPLIDIVDFDGIRNRLWRVSDKETLKNMRSLIKKEKIFIADGHHRYEVGLAFSKTKKDPRYGYILCYFTDLYADGIVVFPVHRMVAGIDKKALLNLEEELKGHFACRGFSSRSEVKAFLSGARDSEKRFVVYAEGRFIGLSLKDRDSLDVSVLHNLIIEPLRKRMEGSKGQIYIDFTKDFNYAINEVDKGSFSLAIMLNPTKITQIRDTAFSGRRMPQKSTYFYPKVLTGLVINVF